jgi:twitching motility protein PilT
LRPAVLREALYQVLNERQKAQLEEHLYVDFGYSVAGVSRFRGSVYFQRGTHAAVFRRIPFTFPTLEDWGLPDALGIPQDDERPRPGHRGGRSGQVLHARRVDQGGAPQSPRPRRDGGGPIEFLLSDSLGSVSQREVGTDTRSFADALRNTLRQDPDIIMVGRCAIRRPSPPCSPAAETGHLVLSTLHSNSAAQTIDRIIDSFPEGQQRQVRMQLAQILQGVISLQLVERADGTGHGCRRGDPPQEPACDEADPRREDRRDRRRDRALRLVREDADDEPVPHRARPQRHHHPRGGARALTRARRVRAAARAVPSPDRQETAPWPIPPPTFSKILELREIRRLYEESQERHRQEMADKDDTIQRLVEQVRTQESAGAGATMQDRALREERDKLVQQLAFQKQEYDAKVEKLQLRIKDLSSQTAEAAGRGGGSIFRR